MEFCSFSIRRCQYPNLSSISSRVTYGWMPTSSNDLGSMRSSMFMGVNPNIVSYMLIPVDCRRCPIFVSRLPTDTPSSPVISVHEFCAASCVIPGTLNTFRPV